MHHQPECLYASESKVPVALPTLYPKNVKFNITLLTKVAFDRVRIYSSMVYGSAIAAHPSKPNQFALGLSDGCVLTLEPREGDWPGRPQLHNVAAA